VLALVAFVGAAVAVSPHRVRAADPVSPLLWGENLSLDNNTGNGDWFLASANLRSALKTAHTQIIRMPVRSPNADTAGWANEPEFKAAAGYVQQLGMVPLVIGTRSCPPSKPGRGRTRGSSARSATSTTSRT
jgi:hypothetical protein